MTLIETLADYTVNYDSSNDEEQALLHFCDTVTALIAGSGTEEFRKVRKFRKALKCGKAFDFIDGFSLAVAATRLSEIDDIHRKSCTTPGSVVWPTILLALNLTKVRSLDEIFAAANIGYNVITGVGEAISGPYILFKGIWPTLFASSFGIVAVMSRLLKLDKQQTLNAYALALATSYGTSVTSEDVLNPRWIVFSNAAENGVEACIAAKRGYACNVSTIEQSYLQNYLNGELDVQKITPTRDTLPEVSIKEYCSAKQVISSITALSNIVSKYSINPKEIQHIQVNVPSFYSKMISRESVRNRLESITSAPYQLAALCVKPTILYDVDRSPLYLDRAIEDLMTKVHVTSDNSLDSFYPEKWPSEVFLETGHHTLREKVIDSPGDSKDGYNLEDIFLKFKRFVKRKDKDSRKIYETMRNMKNIKVFYTLSRHLLYLLLDG